MNIKFYSFKVFCVIVVSGCSSIQDRRTELGYSESPSSTSCGYDASTADALTVGPLKEDYWEFADWIGSEVRPHRAFYQVATGSCSNEVTGVSGTLIHLASGAILNFSNPDRPRANPEARREFEAEPIGASPPPLRDANFVRAARVDGANIGDGGQRDYVGLWSVRRGYVIAKFSVIDGLGAGPAHPLIRSRDPVRGLVYFPAPDVQAGGVSFVQFGRDGVVRLMSFGWDHPDAFPCLTPEQLVTRVAGGVPGPRRSDRRCG